MPRYAQINMETGHVEGNSFLRDAGEEKMHPHLIPIDEDFDLANKKWDFETRSWVTYEPEETEPMLTEAEKRKAMDDYMVMMLGGE